MTALRAAGLSVRPRRRPLVVGVAGVALLVVASVLAIGGGDPLGPGDVIRTLTGDGTAGEEFILHRLLLPRLVAAVLVGAALALAGAIFQALTRNPLGSPDILGFTQGAAAGALVAVVAGAGTVALSFGAVLGGLITGAVVYLVAWRRGAYGYRLVLVGIGVAAILTGVNGYLLTRAELMDAARAMRWLTGSLDGRGWTDTAPLLIVMAVLVPLVLVGYGAALRMIDLGDDTAIALGVNVRRVRVTLLLAAVVLVSFAAAAAGPVAFVALVAPHLAKRLTKAPGPHLVLSLVTGALLLVVADTLAQHGFADRTLPVGVVTGVLGGGYLVWLLAIERKAGRI